MKKTSRMLALCILFICAFGFIYYTKANDRTSLSPQNAPTEKTQLIAEYKRIDEIVEQLKRKNNTPSQEDIDNLISTIEQFSMVEKVWQKEDKPTEISVKFKNGGIISWRVKD